MRDGRGAPVVIRNAPLLDDGTPDADALLAGRPRRGAWRSAGSRPPAACGAAEAEVDPAELADAHARYAAERDAAIPPDHVGPRPSGGRRRHAHRREVPPRPLRLAPGRRRRPRRPLGRARSWRRPEDRGRERRRRRHRHQLGAPARRRRRQRRSSAARPSPASAQGVDRHPPARTRTPSSARWRLPAPSYRAILDAHGADRVRAVATAGAARRRRPRRLPRRRRADVLGAPLELLAGAEEARLGFAGATPGLDPATGPFLVARHRRRLDRAVASASARARAACLARRRQRPAHRVRCCSTIRRSPRS